MTPPPDITTLNPEEQLQYIAANAAEDARGAIIEMLQTIREQQRVSGAALAAATRSQSPAALTDAKAQVNEAKAAADLLMIHRATFEHLHQAAFARGALWAIQQRPRRG
jgi:hypothetical protein